MHSRSRPGKSLRPKGVKPLKLTTLTHFQLFFERPRAPQKQSKWKPEWSVWALKITKIQKQEHSKKQLPHETAKSVFLDTGGGGIERPFFIKNHNHPRNRPYGAPGVQNDRPGLKNNRPGLKNDRKFDNFAYKNQDSCSQANKEIRAN